MPPSTLPPIVARSLPEANDDLIGLDVRAAVISIGKPGSPTPYGFKPRSPFSLRLEFHDVLAPVPEGMTPPAPEHVAAIVEKATLYRAASIVYCHCMAGISRSTAAALILAATWRGADRAEVLLDELLDDRPGAAPHPQMITFADELLQTGGALEDAMRARGLWEFM